MEPGQMPNDPFNQQGNGATPLPGQSVSPTTPYQSAPQQPYTPPQPQTQQPNQYAQQMPTMPPQQQFAAYQTPAPKKSKRLLIIIIAIVLLAVIAGGAMLLLNKKKPQSSATNTGSTGSSNSYASGENSALAALKQNGSSLASINAADLFYAAFRNAAEQPIVTTMTNNYWTPQLNGAPIKSSSSNIDFVSQAGYDYKKNQFAFQANLSGDIERCVDGVEYNASTDGLLSWTKSGLNGDCQPATTTATINDGLNTGGLSTTQAQTFVDAIRNIQGLVNVTKASSVTVQGKSYVRLDVTVNAKTDCYTNSVPSGIGCFGVAFGYLKLPKTWPYVTQASIVSGAQIAYFVDPTTQLPVYAQLAFTPVTATQGFWSNQQVEYSFGPLPTPQASGPVTGISLTWPIAQL
jgi:hypothetical protein